MAFTYDEENKIRHLLNISGSKATTGARTIGQLDGFDIGDADNIESDVTVGKTTDIPHIQFPVSLDGGAAETTRKITLRQIISTCLRSLRGDLRGGAISLAGMIQDWIPPAHPATLREVAAMGLRSPDLCIDNGIYGINAGRQICVRAAGEHTLPPVNQHGFLNGQLFIIQADARNVCRIKTHGESLIQKTNGQRVSYIDLRPGMTVHLALEKSKGGSYGDGNNTNVGAWHVVGGSFADMDVDLWGQAIRDAVSGVNNKVNNLSFVLPPAGGSGFRLCVGYVGSASEYISFENPFPTACGGVVVTPDGKSAARYITNNLVNQWCVTEMSRTGFKVNGRFTGSYIAFGV